MKIPGAERAILDAAKVRDYLLSPTHRVGSAKARFFGQLGFDQRNWTILQDELYGFAKQEAPTRRRDTIWTEVRGARYDTRAFRARRTPRGRVDRPQW